MSITRDAKLNLNVSIPLGQSIRNISALMAGIEALDHSLKLTQNSYDQLISGGGNRGPGGIGIGGAVGTGPPPPAPPQGGHGNIAGAGMAKNVQAGFGYAGRISGAVGTSAAGGLIGSAGGVASAAAAGGPAGIAVAAILLSLETFKVGMEKTTAVMEIQNNSRMSEFQKQRALEEEFVPFAKTIHNFADALNQVQEKFRVAADRHALTMADISVRAQVASEIGSRQRDVLGAQATAAGMRTGQIVANRYFDINAPGGERAEREFTIRQQAQNALVGAERGFTGSSLALGGQEGRSEAARAARDVATGQRQAAERRLQRARAGANQFQSSYNMFTRYDPRPEMNEAAQGLQRTNAREGMLNQQYLQEADALQQRGLENERQRLALAQARLGITRAEAEIERARANQMTADAERLGGMGRAGRRQALRAFQVGQRRGFQNVSPETLSMAAGFDPVEVARQRRLIGEQFLQEFGQQGGATLQEDWRTGNTLEAARRRASELEAIVQTGTDRAAVDSAERIGDIMARSMTRIGDIIQRRIAEVERDMLARFALRNVAPGS